MLITCSTCSTLHTKQLPKRSLRLCHECIFVGGMNIVAGIIMLHTHISANFARRHTRKVHHHKFWCRATTHVGSYLFKETNRNRNVKCAGCTKLAGGPQGRPAGRASGRCFGPLQGPTGKAITTTTVGRPLGQQCVWLRCRQQSPPSVCWTTTYGAA